MLAVCDTTSWILIFLIVSHGSCCLGCDRVQTKFGIVCRCTAEKCDYLPDPIVSGENSWVIISSSKAGLRFSQQEGTFNDTTVRVADYRDSIGNDNDESDLKVDALVMDAKSSWWQIFLTPQKNGIPQSPKKSSAAVAVLRSTTYQKILGFGGALTGTVAHLLENLQPQVQEHFYRSYFHKDGLRYNLLRTSIGGCDFDLQPWAYNEQPIDDLNLSNFTKLDARDELKIQQLKKIQALVDEKHFKIMAAAWSPPTWMKSNNAWSGFSYLKPEYYKTWAQYHMRYLELMQAQNISIWAISTGNEPLNGVIGWFFIHFMSLGWTPTNQAIYLNDHLGPLLKKSKFKDVLIFGNDDQRYTFPSWFQKMKASRANSLNYLDGLAVHWYWDDVFPPNAIDQTTKLMPDKLLINTETCVGDKPWQTHGPELGSWERAEQYARSYLQDLQHNFNGYMDWNLMLDEKGGPNYVDNFVDAAVIVNTTTYSEFYKQPIFYAIGHFAKFITPDSQRILVDLLTVNTSLDCVGFKRPDGTIVLIIFNGGPTSQDVTLSDSVRGTLTLNVPPRSIHTMLYK